MQNQEKAELGSVTQEQAFEFSRHFDNLLWLVTSLLLTANTALLAITVDKLSVQVGLLGIFLSMLTVFFAASFRILRFRIHARLLSSTTIDCSWLFSGPPKWAAQWTVYVLFFSALAGLWVSLLWKRFPECRFVWGLLSAASLGTFVWLYVAARRHTPGDAVGSYP